MTNDPSPREKARQQQKRPTYDQILKLQEDFNIRMTNMFKELIKRGRISPKQWNLQKNQLGIINQKNKLNKHKKENNHKLEDR